MTPSTLLDCGSQVTLIYESVVSSLQLKYVDAIDRLYLSGINSSSSLSCPLVVHIELSVDDCNTDLRDVERPDIGVTLSRFGNPHSVVIGQHECLPPKYPAKVHLFVGADM